MTHKPALIICFVSLALSSEVAPFDIVTGRGEGIGRAVILSRSSASELLAVPAGGLGARQGLVEIGFNRAFEMSELDNLYVAGAYCFGSVTTAIGFSQFGHSDLYTEQTAKLSLAIRRDSLTAAVTLAGLLVSLGGGYERLDATTLGCGLSYRTRRIIVAVTGENLTAPRLQENSREINPLFSGYAELIGPGPYSLTGRVTLEREEKPQFAVGQKIDLSTKAAFFWGIATAPLKYGGGLEVDLEGRSLTYVVSYHPTLGLSQTVALSLVFGSTRM